MRITAFSRNIANKQTRYQKQHLADRLDVVVVVVSGMQL